MYVYTPVDIMRKQVFLFECAVLTKWIKYKLRSLYMYMLRVKTVGAFIEQKHDWNLYAHIIFRKLFSTISNYFLGQL